MSKLSYIQSLGRLKRFDNNYQPKKIKKTESNEPFFININDIYVSSDEHMTINKLKNTNTYGK